MDLAFALVALIALVAPTTYPTTRDDAIMFSLNNASLTDSGHAVAGFKSGPDPAVARRPGKPSMLLMSATPVKPTQVGHVFGEVDVKPFLGKRVRLSAYVRAEKPANWAGIGLQADQRGGKWLLFDTMSNRLIGPHGAVDRAIMGSTDWRRLEVVADIPDDALHLRIGAQLAGGGKLWIDDARVETVGDDVPTTDDQNLHLFSFDPRDYSASYDAAAQQDGKPTLRIESRPGLKNGACVLGRADRHPDDYLGHRVRLWAWVKTEALSGEARLKIVAAIPKQNDQQIDDGIGQPAVTGTSDWKKYEVTADVAPETQCLMFNLDVSGRGRVWVGELHVEVLATAP